MKYILIFLLLTNFLYAKKYKESNDYFQNSFKRIVKCPYKQSFGIYEKNRIKYCREDNRVYIDYEGKTVSKNISRIKQCKQNDLSYNSLISRINIKNEKEKKELTLKICKYNISKVKIFLKLTIQKNN